MDRFFWGGKMELSQMDVHVLPILRQKHNLGIVTYICQIQVLKLNILAKQVISRETYDLKKHLRFDNVIYKHMLHMYMFYLSPPLPIAFLSNDAPN